MELVTKLSKKAALFLVLLLLTSLIIFFPWEQYRSNLTIGHHLVSVIDGLQKKVGFPRTRMNFPGKAAQVITNGMEEWNPYKDILDETEIMKDGPLVDLKKAINKTFSKVYLIGDSSQYTVGDEVRIGVKLVDSYNTVRTKGGDQLRVRIFEGRDNASASGYLIDHKNGTYTAVVRALWSGSPKIVVYSAYPREAVRSLYYTYSQIPATRVYSAHYQYKNTTVTGLCHPFLNMVWNGTAFYCNKTNHNGGMSLYCVKPESVTCNDFVHYSLKPDSNPKTRTEAERALLRRNMEILEPSLQINVTGAPTISKDKLPKCAEYRKKDLWMKKSPVGFFYNGTWRTLHCKSPSIPSIYKCIRGMHFTLIGDSTTRQWFEHLVSTYSCAFIKSKSRKSHKFCASSRHNFTAEWAMHSIPGFFQFEETPESTSGIMAECSFTKSHIFLFHMQVHVSAYHPSVFRDRTTHIRNTVQKILDVNRNARFFVKGPHTFKDTGQFGDYFGYVYRVMMLEIFQGLYDKITFLDSKDMTIATYQTDFHPKKGVIKAMVQQFLSYVCAPTISKDKLPKCAEYRKKDLWMKKSPVGFFYNGTWRTLHCKSPSIPSIYKCIRGMHFTLIGDSTTRQWFEHLVSTYSCAFIKSKSRKSHKFCASSRHNFTAEWAMHSIPGFFQFEETPESTSGIMAECSFTKSHIFLFHMQVHVSAYHPSVFRDRTTHIRNTVQKILDVNRNARFFVKGPHTFKDTGQFGDYFGYVYRVMMLEIFQGLYDKITFLDSKDMTIATYQTDFHPKKGVIKAMVQQFLSYVCD